MPNRDLEDAIQSAEEEARRASQYMVEALRAMRSGKFANAVMAAQKAKLQLVNFDQAVTRVDSVAKSLGPERPGAQPRSLKDRLVDVFEGKPPLDMRNIEKRFEHLFRQDQPASAPVAAPAAPVAPPAVATPPLKSMPPNLAPNKQFGPKSGLPGGRPVDRPLPATSSPAPKIVAPSVAPVIPKKVLPTAAPTRIDELSDEELDAELAGQQKLRREKAKGPASKVKVKPPAKKKETKKPEKKKKKAYFDMSRLARLIKLGDN